MSTPKILSLEEAKKVYLIENDVFFFEKDLSKLEEDFIDKTEFIYNEKENILEKITNSSYYSVPLNKISKKNCNSNENGFSIEILNTDCRNIIIGLSPLSFYFKQSDEVNFNKHRLWINGFNFYNYKEKEIKNGDVIGLQYDSIKGEIEFFLNFKTTGIIKKVPDIIQNYRFTITLYDVGDKVQII